MASTTYVDFSPPTVSAAWLNDVNHLVYTVFGDGTTYANTTPLWRMDTAGRWINPGNTHPAFRAERTSTTQTSGATFLFNTSTENHGATYATGTGLVTIPVAGFYFFHTSCFFGNSSGGTITAGARIVTVGGFVIGISQQIAVATGNNIRVDTMGIHYCAAADQVKVINDSSASLAANYVLATASYFQGWLIK